MTTRLLYTCISSKLYNEEHTLRDLNAAWAEQMRSLYVDGLQVEAWWNNTHALPFMARAVRLEVNGKSLCLKLVPIANKGDWPFLRKATWPACSAVSLCQGICFGDRIYQ